MPIRNISNSDWKTLGEMKEWFLRNVQNQPLRLSPKPTPPQAPEVYIALPPAGGIPGMTRAGTSSPPVPDSTDSPGSADCDIYQLVPGDSQPFQKVRSGVKVYNLLDQTITNDWVVVIRDKFGRWWVPTIPEVTTEGTGCPGIPGLEAGDIGIETSVTWVLGLDANGCVVKVSVEECNVGTGSGTGV